MRKNLVDFIIQYVCDSPVSWAVHGLEREGFLLHVEREHVLSVMRPVARCLPQFGVEHIRGNHLLEAADSVQKKIKVMNK